MIQGSHSAQQKAGLPSFSQPAQEASLQTDVRHLDHAKLSIPRVAVSGGAVTGCFAAMIARTEGFEVDLFEMRPEPTRQIQWSVRQAFLDSLAKIDPEGAERLYQAIHDPNNELASLMPRGSIKTLSINGEYYLPSRESRIN